MNRVFQIGNIAKDPEHRVTPNGKSVCTFSLAVRRRNKDEADFFNVVVWGATADACKQYVHKGSKVGIIGSLQSRMYEKDGQKRYITEIVADEVEFLDKKPKDAPVNEDIPF